MRIKKLHEVCTNKGYKFTYENEITVIKFDGDISFRIKVLPDNIIFKNKGNVKLEILVDLPETTKFFNKGNVILSKTTVIPEKFNSFHNNGLLVPENCKYKLPLIKYCFSDEFNFFLQENSKNKYVAKLIKLNNTPIKDDELQGSFIDCIDEDDISYLPIQNIFKKYKAVISKSKNTYSSLDNYFTYSKNKLFKEGLKNRIKVGRFIKKFFNEMTDIEVEEFVNLLKGFKNNMDCGMDIVRGADIVKYYNSNNQKPAITGSCMNYANESDIKFQNLQFYASIPNCGLLVLRDKEDTDKIRARALIWTSKDNRTYVDRIYTTKQSDVYIYKKYIMVNKCLSYVNGDAIRDFEIECPPEVSELKHYMPYLDTLLYDKKKNIVKAQR